MSTVTRNGGAVAVLIWGSVTRNVGSLHVLYYSDQVFSNGRNGQKMAFFAPGRWPYGRYSNFERFGVTRNNP